MLFKIKRTSFKGILRNKAMERGKYKGWIIADYEDKDFLEKLGVKLGRYNEKTASFEDCELSLETLEKLGPYWGDFYWGLERGGNK